MKLLLRPCEMQHCGQVQPWQQLRGAIARGLMDQLCLEGEKELWGSCGGDVAVMAGVEGESDLAKDEQIAVVSRLRARLRFVLYLLGATGRP